MFGNVCRGIPGERFEDLIEKRKREAGVKEDTELSVDDLKALTEEFKEAYDERRGFPQDPRDQLREAISAVFDSWMGHRAVEYRRINRIPDTWGTAVNVQQMVFGNRGDRSCSGVAFSRDEITGAPEPSGDFLVNAQGEDVVSGVRTPRDISEMKKLMPEAHDELMEILRTLERHYRDMQDTEFTVEEGDPLHAPDAQREAARAGGRAFRGGRGRGGAPRQGRGDDDDRRGAPGRAAAPGVRPRCGVHDPHKGRGRLPGRRPGEIVFTADDAVAAADDGRDVILVRPFTEADDVHGFQAAKGILTSKGGKASHAALVARGMGKPCVAGAGELEIDLQAKTLRVGDTELSEGDRIAIDGSTGVVTADDVPLEEPEVSGEFKTVLRWADELRSLGVRANADTARGRGQGARIRRGGDRAVPHGAHVPRHRAPGHDAGDDHGRERRGAAEGA